MIPSARIDVCGRQRGRVAPSQIVILPVLAKEESRAAVLEAANNLAAQLRTIDVRMNRIDRLPDAGAENL